MTPTDIHIPAEVFSLLEATAIANGYTPEEVTLAAIEAFLQSDIDQQASTD
jgi:stage V sporulation protein SpoVS